MSEVIGLRRDATDTIILPGGSTNDCLSGRLGQKRFGSWKAQSVLVEILSKGKVKLGEVVD